MAMQGDGSIITNMGQPKNLTSVPESEKRGEKVMERHEFHRNAIMSTWGICVLILALGLASSGAFMRLGINRAMEEQDNHFERSSTDLVKKVESAWEDYVNAALVIHNRCRSRTFTRQDFRDLYEYLVASGLDFQVAQLVQNIT